MQNIYFEILHKFNEKVPLALATIIATEGSTPQIPGASALFSTDGLICGTLGGGILEADAGVRAMAALEDESAFLYQFALDADIRDSEGAVCGGNATVLLDPRPERSVDVFRQMQGVLLQRHFGALLTLIAAKKNKSNEVTISRHWYIPEAPLPEHFKTSRARLSSEVKKSLTKNAPFFFTDSPENSVFIEPLYPLPRLIIAGAGHVGRAVAHLGSLLDFDVFVIDERPQFANRENIPKASFIIDGYESAIGSISIEADTYIVIVTPGHRNDAEVLRNCIKSDAAYIGVIGSTRKVAQMRKAFLEEGWASEAQFDRVFTPIGIDINSKTVQEIAVSIAAQLVLIRSQKQHHRKVQWSGP